MGITAEFEFLPFSDKPNGNGRIYNYDSVDLTEFQEKIDRGIALGELCHDRSPCTEIILSEVSHKIISAHKEKKGIYGVIEILDTPRGSLAQHMIDGMLVVRPRSIGEIDSFGIVTVNELITFDLLALDNDSFNPDSYKNRRYRLKKN